MKKPRVRLWSLLLLSAGLLLVILFSTWIASKNINRITQEQCFDDLANEAKAMGREIERNVEANRQELEMLANVAADYADLEDPHLWDKLKRYTMTGMLSRVEILLPGDVVLTQDGRKIDVTGQLSFEEEAAKGEYISGRMEDVTGDGGYILRHYIPIERGGETVAMLYGVAVLAEMPGKLLDQPYGGEAAAYLIDRSNGDFLMDTWHDELGNIWAFSGRQMAPGYSDEQLRQGVANGESNYVVFVSQTIGSYLYFYYTPISVNDWSVAISVPEDLVLWQVRETQRTLRVFVSIELVAFLVYLAWVLYFVYIETKENNDRVDMLNGIYEVERLLFNAHENSDQVSAALEQVAGLLQAEQADFWMMTQPGYDVSFTWSRPGSMIQQNEFSVKRENAYNMIRYFSETGDNYYSAAGESLLQLFPKAPAHGVNSQAALPIREAQSGICGILSVYNLKEENSRTLLRSLEGSFGMFCHNMRTYQNVKEQGERDLLTGLYNRNRYEQDSADCRDWYRDTLACIYMDANGLHELNNSQGHAAGDRMLQTVADLLEKYFGDAHSYRIGGDEFLAFAPDRALAAVEQMANQCMNEVEQAGYNVAVGVAQMRDITDTAELVAAAEQKMYAAKQAYYAALDRRDMR